MGDVLRGWVTILSAPLSSGLAQHRSQQTTLTEPESPLLLCSPPLPQVCWSPEVLHSVVEGTIQPSQSNPLNSPQPHPTGQALDGDRPQGAVLAPSCLQHHHTAMPATQLLTYTEPPLLLHILACAVLIALIHRPGKVAVQRED